MVGKTASELGIHRTTVWRWKKKASVRPGVLSSRNLERKSTRPIRSRRILAAGERVDIEELRIAKGWTAERITKKLGFNVSSRTVHRFLKTKGLVREYGYYRRPKFQDTTHMHAKNTPTIGYLQMDVKYITPEL